MTLKTKKIPLYFQIIIGLVLGLGYSVLATFQGWITFTEDWISPFGKIFINSLKLIAVPLVLVSLIVGIASMNNIRTLGKMGGKSIFIYISTTVIAIIIGLLLVNTVQPGKFMSDETRGKLVEKYSYKSVSKIEVAKVTKENGPLQPLIDLVPSNFITSASDNRNMLQIIFFAILFGVAMVMIPESKSLPTKVFFESVNEIILKIVDIIMIYSPIGVFALLAGVLVQVSEGDIGFAFQILTGLGIYSLTVIVGLSIMIFIIYPFLIRRFAKVKFKTFLKAISPAQLLAFSTSSSAATLPLTMERVEEELGVSKRVSSFVLPLGATINMDGTSLYQAVAAVFIAQSFNIDLTVIDQLAILVTATLASIGSAAVPGAGLVMLTIVLGLFPEIPIEGIGLVFAVDRILDMCRTTVNVTGDASVAAIVAYSENEINTIEK
ncbi:MAG: dicarboxylate/amino acid:cation symporter [Crocinitomicaceae bacterium]|nr:dicarboxylate/amino acid:cation symporter [Crocinitomicaceae bacterium]|tara:strand:+ start:2371 stop:3678 length:1308 start_codon:yes stop_codon:yes gene_type:complete